MTPEQIAGLVDYARNMRREGLSEKKILSELREDVQMDRIAYTLDELQSIIKQSSVPEPKAEKPKADPTSKVKGHAPAIPRRHAKGEERFRLIPEFPSYAIGDRGGVKRIVSGKGSKAGEYVRPRGDRGMLFVRLSHEGRQYTRNIMYLMMNAGWLKKRKKKCIGAASEHSTKLPVGMAVLPSIIDGFDERQGLNPDSDSKMLGV
jgi:hypothetical protein